MRFCIDFKRLNNVTEKCSYPPPDIQDCLEPLAGNFFSQLNLAPGFWQISIAEKARGLTAFRTEDWLYCEGVLGKTKGALPTRPNRMRFVQFELGLTTDFYYFTGTLMIFLSQSNPTPTLLCARVVQIEYNVACDGHGISVSMPTHAILLLQRTK